MNIIMLDTSVFIKLRSKRAKPVVQGILKRYSHTPIYVSDMTYFEYLRTCQNKSEIHKSLEALGEYGRLEVDTRMISYATYYYNVLVKSKNHDGKRAIGTHQLSDSDIIIGASAVRAGALMVTTDRNDFPAPFFTEISSEYIDDREKIFVLQADTLLYDRTLKHVFN
jgi:predicted nucleic acid-binding protein